MGRADSLGWQMEDMHTYIQMAFFFNTGDSSHRENDLPNETSINENDASVGYPSHSIMFRFYSYYVVFAYNIRYSVIIHHIPSIML